MRTSQQQARKCLETLRHADEIADQERRLRFQQAIAREVMQRMKEPTLAELSTSKNTEIRNGKLFAGNLWKNREFLKRVEKRWSE